MNMKRGRDTVKLAGYFAVAWWTGTGENHGTTLPITPQSRERAVELRDDWRSRGYEAEAVFVQENGHETILKGDGER